MKISRRAALSVAAFAALAGPARPQSRRAQAERIFARLHPRTGHVRVDAAHMTIDLPDGYGLLDHADTQTLFVDLYGNPPEDSEQMLGAILPLNVLPGTPERSFEIGLRFIPGRVAETGVGATLDPAAIDRAYARFSAALNERRRQAGAPVLSNEKIVEPASYDRQQHQLTVGRAFQWPGEDFLSVNYCAYQLTRDGVVQFLATSTLVTLPLIKQAMGALGPTVRLDAGQRYEDGAALPVGKTELRELAIGSLSD